MNAPNETPDNQNPGHTTPGPVQSDTASHSDGEAYPPGATCKLQPAICNGPSTAPASPMDPQIHQSSSPVCDNPPLLHSSDAPTLRPSTSGNGHNPQPSCRAADNGRLTTDALLSNSQTPQLPNSASSSPQHSITPKSRRRNGLVAQLSKPVRDRINQMLDDGLSYPKIVKALASEAPGLTVRGVMSWKQGGYQDYLRQQQLLEECRARTERAFSMLREQNPLGAFQATQQIATAQICKAVADVGSDILRQALAANPLNYFRMLNSFARLTNGGLKCDRHLQDDLDRRAKDLQAAQPREGGMSSRSIKDMEDSLALL